MGKKGSWFSAIKKVFNPHSKEKLADESERRPAKEKKKKGFGKRRNGDNNNSFLPIFREPSSIEQILGEAEREHNLVFIAPNVSDPPRTVTSQPPRPASPPRIPSQRFVSPSVPSPRPVSPQTGSPRGVSPRAVSPRGVSPRGFSPRAAIPKAPAAIPNATTAIPNAPSLRAAQRRKEIGYKRPEPTVANRRASAIKIQAAFRGYMARRSFRALKGLVRLQGVVRGQSVKRQTTNAMKYMQLLVRVQTQIQSRRIQMIENQARRNANRDDRESTLAKWMASDAGNEDWDDSLLTKEEKEARMQRKVNAIVKRERSMAYAYSHQLWKNSPRSGLSDIRPGGYPLWWNWLDRELPQPSPYSNQNQSVKDFRLTPGRPSPSPLPSSNNQTPFRFDNFDTPTPKSSKSTILTPARPLPFRTPQPHSVPKLQRGRAAAATSVASPFKDDDSLLSCPPFSAPSYMTPTVSAKAKARANSNPRERVGAAVETPSGGEKRRMSFPLTQGIGSFRWNRGSLFSKQSKGGSSSRGAGLEKNQTIQSIGNTSVDSTVSMPAAVGRRPFNRFV